MDANLIKSIDNAKQFAKEHIKECSVEICEWRDTGFLKEGRVRELAMLVTESVGVSQSLVIAESFVLRAALEFAAK